MFIDQNIILSVQSGKISTGKAKELLEEDIKIQLKEAFKKVFVCDEDVMGIKIIKKPHEGDWFEKLCNDIFENLSI